MGYFISIPFLLALFVTSTFLYLFFHNPVQRDRHLYAKSGWGMFWYSLGFVIVVLSVIWAMSCGFNVEADKIYNSKPENPFQKGDKLFTLIPGIDTLWNVMCQFADPGNINQSVDNGNWIAIISAFAGIICLSGLLVSSLVSMISHRTNKWKQGNIHYKCGFNNYVVIIGVNEQAPAIIQRSLDRQDVNFVLIQTKRDVEKARQAIELKLDNKYEKNVVFYFGDRTSYEDIKQLRLEKAKEVFILGESLDDNDVMEAQEKDHDAFNINCLEHISHYFEKEKGKREKERVNTQKTKDA